MCFWRRLVASKPPPSPAIALFVDDMLAKREGDACCRLQVAELAHFWALLTQKLRQRGLHDRHVNEALRGRLVGQCPRCLVRLDAGYIAWLVEHARHGAPGREAKRAARFAAGRCVNEECSSTELFLYWRPGSPYR